MSKKILIEIDYANVKDYVLVKTEGNKTDLGFQSPREAFAFILKHEMWKA